MSDGVGCTSMGFAKDLLETYSSRRFGDTGVSAVCLDCILDEGLRAAVREYVTEPWCSGCGRVGDEPVGVPLDVVLERVLDVARVFYGDAGDEGVWVDVWDDWTCGGGDVLDDVAGEDVAEEVLALMKDVMDDSAWVSHSYRVGTHLDALRGGWEGLVEVIKHRTRFVFLATPPETSDRPDELTVTEFLDELIAIIRDHDLVRELPGGTRIWRGRMVASPQDAASWQATDLGSPPAANAQANRMSPAGISMFYGSDTVATVVAEIGADPVRRHAAVGCFETLGPVSVLDLTALPDPPSMYDPALRRESMRLRFLHGFVRDLQAPVVLDGREHVEYVPTQIIAEYLRWVSGLGLGGIRYRSARNGGLNLVLFVDDTGCVDAGSEDRRSRLRLVPGSRTVVPVTSAVSDA